LKLGINNYLPYFSHCHKLPFFGLFFRFLAYLLLSVLLHIILMPRNNTGYYLLKNKVKPVK